MPIAKFMHVISTDKITIEPDRQRKDLGDLTELKESIKTIGLLNPIIITRDYTLIAGERRLTAYKQLSETDEQFSKIPYRYFDETTTSERAIVELHENLRRRELTWKEEATAIESIQNILESEGKKTLDELAEAVGMSRTWVQRRVQVAAAIADGDEEVIKAETIGEAINVIKRKQGRVLASIIANGVPDALIGNTTKNPPETAPTCAEPKAAPSHTPAPETHPAPVSMRPRRSRIKLINADFRKWAAAYSGPPFTLLHVDFPYGINHKATAQNTASDRIGYSDTIEDWKYCTETLSMYANKLISPLAHMLFWFPIKNYTSVYDYLSKLPNAKVNPVPMIWTRHRGILAAPNYGPRNCYEAAFLVTFGNMMIVKAIDNYVDCNDKKGVHVSEKPLAMLSKFLSMLVDKDTIFLDPTCGSGTSLVAAAKLDAAKIVGIEKNPEFCAAAKELIALENA